MKTEEAIKLLKEKGYKIEEPERFLKVRLSDRDNVFLTDNDGNIILASWRSEKDLNDFGYIKENNYGHFFIRGNVCKFEFYYKGEWLECDERMDVRFLR